MVRIPLTYVVCYDIADDDRRAAVSDCLSQSGARVQLSVFEVELPSRQAADQLRRRLRGLIDRVEDQVRLYPLAAESVLRTTILGDRRLEERADYWIV